MGIKDLWQILLPLCERKPLFELRGKAVAIDLSGWICEAQCVSNFHIQPRMYLRNLYFRTMYLLLNDIKPVFVLEGKAPKLKYKTIDKRNQIKSNRPNMESDKNKTGKDRTRFNYTLKQCEEMLKLMGLICVQGNGEAEALCAHLNEENLVAGCISQDSDCFAYGARVVFRNFSISHQGSYSASGGAVDVYDMQKINEKLNIGRNKMIALALLCGSDYNEGVRGIGKESVLKFLDKFQDDEILDRLRAWKQEDFLAEYKDIVQNKNFCVKCGHVGRFHTKSGCKDCKTTKGCDTNKSSKEMLDIKNELQMQVKALNFDENFPDESIIDEFQSKKDDVLELDLNWRTPDLNNFIQFCTKLIGWEEIYAFEKSFPILTRWQVKNPDKKIIHPIRIKKIRHLKCIPSFEIIWDGKDFENLIPISQLQNHREKHKTNELESLWTTIEPVCLVESAYPNLVKEYEDSKPKKAKKTTRQRKNEASTSAESKTKKIRNNQSNKIENYFSKVKQIPEDSLYGINESDFLEEDLDLSEIVDEITKHPPKLPEKVAQLGYEVVLTNKTETIEAGTNVWQEKNETSFFFNMNYDEVDLFEKTFEVSLIPDDNSFDDSTELNETFDEKYVPLLERIKNANN